MGGIRAAASPEPRVDGRDLKGQHLLGGPEYFALWSRAKIELKDFLSVIRRTEAGEEVHVGRSGWVPSGLAGEVERGEFSSYRPLPVTAEEAEAIIARQTGRRLFVILNDTDGRDLPVAVVRVHGEREEAFTRDLVWDRPTAEARGQKPCPQPQPPLLPMASARTLSANPHHPVLRPRWIFMDALPRRT